MLAMGVCQTIVLFERTDEKGRTEGVPGGTKGEKEESPSRKKFKGKFRNEKKQFLVVHGDWG